MSDIVERLRGEHADMDRLLGVLERQLDAFAAGGAPDYEILQAVVDYFLDYPDRVHHPKEDVLARAVLAQSPDTAAIPLILQAQHEELADLARRFGGFVRRVLEEAELPRDKLLTRGSEFIAFQREHMRMEERHFFPAAERALSTRDLARLEDELAASLTDPGAEARFAAMRADILRWAAAARAE